MKIDNQKLDLMLARRCMSLRDLRNGTSPQTLTRIRRGENIKPVTVGRIAKALDCDPTDIIQDATAIADNMATNEDSESKFEKKKVIISD